MKQQKTEWIDDMPIPTEAQEQETLMKWVRMMSGRWPELELMYHAANEGKRSRIAGHHLKLQGLKKGVPDLCLPVARGGCHALYIELKRTKGGRVSPEQTEWMTRLMAEGNQCAICYGWEHAAEVIEKYLGSDEE